MSPVLGQQEYDAFFEEAYKQNPSIPRGMLESVAWTRTRIKHIRPKPKDHDCLGMPEFFGVMGLVENGKGYFNNSLKTVAELSGYSAQEIKNDPRINILAYAKAYAATKANKRLASDDPGQQRTILSALSEIPQDNSDHNSFATDQQFYSVLKKMEDSRFRTNHRIPARRFDYNAIFGADNYKILSSDYVTISKESIRNRTGKAYTSYPGARAPSCTQSTKKTDFKGALWAPAHPRNYGSRNGKKVEFVTIHTVQGSYASCISWFQNSIARVSAHYVVRASDGQVTQMVCENDKGFHVRQANSSAVGIEHEGFIDEGASWYTNEMYEASAALVRFICERHGINPLQTYSGPPTNGRKVLGNTCTKVKGHQHFPENTHVDPGKFWDWDRFYRLVNGKPKLTTLNDKNGTFTDPGGTDKNYGDQARQAYLIQPKNANYAELTFTDFEMEGDEKDKYDYLDIYEGTDANGVFLGRFSGNTSPGTLTSSRGAFYIEFRSDCQFNKKGWVATYSSNRKKLDCAPPEDLQVRGLYALGASLSWQGSRKADFYLVYLRRKNIGDQKWAAYKTRSTGLTVTGLSANGLYQWQVSAICGDDTSALVGASFVTPNISRKGSPQRYTIRLNSGNFNDSGGKLGPYSDEEAFLYTIQPANGKPVELVFYEFETEEDLDVMKIYDGPSTGSPLIGKYSGKKSPVRVTSTGGALTIQFTSDRRTTAKGWRASWRTVGSGGGNTPPDPGNDTGGSDTPPPVLDRFKLSLSYPADAPSSSPQLKSKYTGDFQLGFKDIDKSGRGVANRFYLVSRKTSSGWRANGSAGFFLDNFSSLHRDWTRKTGTWQVSKGVLVQSDEQVGNSNVYASLKQDGQTTYVYQFKARMSGSGNNRRLGLHFFCSEPAKEDRGNSYFLWARDATSGGKVELYKVVNDEFSRKAQKDFTFEAGKVYLYKVVYNPQKGRMEVYINNDFVVAWNDGSPHRSGRGISFRSGGCVAEFDDLMVFKRRSSTANIRVGTAETDDIRLSTKKEETDFRVYALLVDRSITWSSVGSQEATVKGGTSSSVNSGGTSSGNAPKNGGTTSSGGTTPKTDPPKTDPKPPTKPPVTSSDKGHSVQPKPTFKAPLSKRVWLGKQYSDDFFVEMPKRSEVQEQFFLVADYNGKHWSTNESEGFFYDDFESNTLNPKWKAETGKWVTSQNNLKQVYNETTNANLYAPLTQTGQHVYVYHWTARILTVGDNKRFGIHFFADDPKQTNRGNSYFIWFRNNTGSPDKVEIYRSVNNNLQLKTSAPIDITADEWYDCKVRYEPLTGRIDV
ncbi:MAG: CUB domain-containing protein, partial [Bacteroidota bacterium]